MPWGADNQMPYDILGLIESDETVSTCNIFNAELCYGAGIEYHDREGNTPQEVEDFLDDNAVAELYMGQCFDMKTFGFCITVVILDQQGRNIISVARREAIYCRFAPMDKNGRIPFVHYANWRRSSAPEDVESIELLDSRAPFKDLADRIGRGSKCRKFAVVSRLPTIDSTYYPIPYYASLFKGKWFAIKRDLGIAKHSKLKNSAPIRYHIEIADSYWENVFRAERITDSKKKLDRQIQLKQQIVDFLTGAENSGKAWFSRYYISPDGKEQHDIRINKVDDSKEGGDWSTDIQEAVNMICFVMRIHSNLVGSVPGKSQSNNSGSDKRELYTISQASQKMYRDAIFRPHRLIIRFNGWKVRPVCPFIQLSTLDEHQDAKKVSL
ncbi:MAG: hypothetical protein K2J70_06780 [Muribaculaceae bacterium]|nr:hypothetical protein [Muribaculaceae bacterium]